MVHQAISRGRVNFIAGSSSMSNLGNDYYVQNFYDIPSYKSIRSKPITIF